MRTPRSTRRTARTNSKTDASSTVNKPILINDSEPTNVTPQSTRPTATDVNLKIDNTVTSPGKSSDDDKVPDLMDHFFVVFNVKLIFAM